MEAPVSILEPAENILPIYTQSVPFPDAALMRYDTVKTGIGKINRTLDKVTKGIGQLTICPVLEILPAEIAVLAFRIIHGDTVT